MGRANHHRPFRHHRVHHHRHIIFPGNPPDKQLDLFMDTHHHLRVRRRMDRPRNWSLGGCLTWPLISKKSGWKNRPPHFVGFKTRYTRLTYRMPRQFRLKHHPTNEERRRRNLKMKEHYVACLTSYGYPDQFINELMEFLF